MAGKAWDMSDVDGRRYRVVVNDEEQYSIWPGDQGLPGGWHAEGTEGDRSLCLEHIERVWTDMRPRSVREHLSA